jgi:hypothetical protein
LLTLRYISIGPSALVTRLLTRNLHVVALRISKHLGLRTDPVLKHWASARIARAKADPRDAESDAALCADIVLKFEHEGEKGVSYAEIARNAWEAGRVKLATMLLDYEPRAAEQVPLLLQMKEDRIALEKAVDSGDTDLVYHVLLRLRSTLSPGDFFHLVDDSVSPQLAPAVRLLQVYARDNDRQLLRDFYYQDDRRTESATLEMDEAGSTPVLEDRIEHLRTAQRFFSEHKDRAFEARMAEEAHRLLALQATYERELENKFVFRGLTVDAFISLLLVEGLSKRAENVRAAWKVPDRRWWWLKLKALANTHNWEGLAAFAKSKKSPIGYEPFVVSNSTLHYCIDLADHSRHTCSASRRRSLNRPRRTCRGATRASAPTCTSSAGSGARLPRPQRSVETKPSLSKSSQIKWQMLECSERMTDIALGNCCRRPHLVLPNAKWKK